MSSPPTIEPFKGTNWEECNHFIRAIHAAAWREGKFRDPAWIADFAALHFSHKALSWRSRLPRDIREDWEKLQVALLDRWPPPEDDDEPRIEPTPAAAPSLGRSDKADRPLNGILKVIIDGTNTTSYIKFGDGYSSCDLTDKATEALRIRCNSLSNATLFERIDGSRHSWLGVQWASTNPDLKNGSTCYGHLVLVESLKFKSSWTTSYPYQLASSTVSANREIIPFWEIDDTCKITIGIICTGNALLIAADTDAYSKRYSGWKRAKIFFEQLES